ncbi:hypothetical protein CWI12_07690, partial [Streptococcus pneumoniae]
YRSYGTFFYNKIGSIISIVDLPTTNIIEPFLWCFKEQNGCRLLREHGSRWRVLLDDHCHNYV